MVLALFLAITNGLVCSCSKDELQLPETYKVSFENNYFEPVIVKIDSIQIPKLLPDSISQPVFLSQGNYKIRCITKSYLLIENELDLKGTKENVNIRLTKKGKIVLNEK